MIFFCPKLLVFTTLSIFSKLISNSNFNSIKYKKILSISQPQKNYLYHLPSIASKEKIKVWDILTFIGKN